MLYRFKQAALILFYITGLIGFFYSPASAQQANRLTQTELLVKRKPDSAYLLLQDILKEAVEKGDALTEAVCHQQIGQVFYNNGNYAQAVDHLLRAEKIFRKERQQDELAKNLNYLGHVYYSNKQPDLAGKQFEEALLINKQLKNTDGIALTYGNIGHYYEKKLSYDSAYYYQQKALELYRQAKDSMGMAKIFENMGSIFEDREVFDSAKTCFEQALLINQRYNDEIARIEILNNLGDVNRKTGKYAEGLLYTRKALQLAEKTQSQYQLASAYRDMARGYELLHNFDSAYDYNERSRQLVEEIYSASNNRQIALLETIYDVEKKNSQIKQLALDKKINAIISIAIASVIALLVVLGAVIISRQRLKIKNEKALNEQNKHIYEKNRELMQAELKNKQLEEENLRSSLEVRNKELSVHTLHIIQKNQLLEDFSNRLETIVKDEKRDHKKQLQQLIRQMQENLSHSQQWDEFRESFEKVHQHFLEKLKDHSSDLSSNDLRLIALIKLNLSSKDIATLLSISPESLRVARYRLRKKLKLEQGDSLSRFIQFL